MHRNSQTNTKDEIMHIHLSFSLYPKKKKVHPVVYFLFKTKR